MPEHRPSREPTDEPLPRARPQPGRTAGWQDRRPTGRRLAALLAVLSLGGAMAALINTAGCSREAEDVQPDALRTDTYTTLGIVAEIPVPELPGSRFQIAHEHVPDFKDRDNQVFHNLSTGVRGMPAMTMPLELSEGVSIQGLDPGDPVEFTWEVTYYADPNIPALPVLVGVRPLPPGTPVDPSLKPTAAESAEPVSASEPGSPG